MMQNGLQIGSYLESLVTRGRYHFTTAEYTKNTGKSNAAAWAAIRRSGERGQIATPYRGFHVIVPPEYRAIGCLPAEQFIPQLMAFLNEPYYVGLLSAAAYYGASHHAPQEFQVVIARNRKSIHIGKIRIVFVAKKQLAQVPTVTRNTKTGIIKVATAEATALDLVDYKDHCGGLDNVATVLNDLAEKLTSPKLLETANTLGPINLAQRLGYLLEKVDAKNKAYALSKYIADIKPRYTKLDPSLPKSDKKDINWRLIVNCNIEPDI